MSPSRAPVLSFARYFQAPATQANLFFACLLLLRELRASIWRAAGVLPCTPVVSLGALIPLLSGAIMGVYETAGAESTRFHIQTCYFKINSYLHSESCKHKAERPFRFFSAFVSLLKTPWLVLELTTVIMLETVFRRKKYSNFKKQEPRSSLGIATFGVHHYSRGLRILPRGAGFHLTTITFVCGVSLLPLPSPLKL